MEAGLFMSTLKVEGKWRLVKCQQCKLKENEGQLYVNTES